MQGNDTVATTIIEICSERNLIAAYVAFSVQTCSRFLHCPDFLRKPKAITYNFALVTIQMQ